MTWTLAVTSIPADEAADALDRQAKDLGADDDMAKQMDTAISFVEQIAEDYTFFGSVSCYGHVDNETANVSVSVTGKRRF